MLLPVIMAGGSGSRLWPLSRSLYPKQFINLAGERSMLQETIIRLSGIEHLNPLVVCNNEHRFIVAEQLRNQAIQYDSIILEPVGRNTAPAIALAALYASKQNLDCLLLVLAADHVIQNQSAFNMAVHNAIKPAENGMLVTFGIVPTKAETGYGYIKKGNALDTLSCFYVEQFVEKPNLNTAEQYLASGKYYWNSGMFLFKASRYLEELKKFRPSILEMCEAAMNGASKDLDFIRLDENIFAQCPDESVDYAVMENTTEAVIVPMVAGWSDVGSWSSIWDISDKNENSNVIHGDVLTEDSYGCYINSPERLIATVGVEDLIIVDTKDALLVASKNKVQGVKNIVDQLNIMKRNESKQHREVFRPWGSHDEIAQGHRYLVKQLRVKPGEKTALQMHYHRSEHWVVVQGTAKVTNGEKSYLVSENESTYIPLGSSHRIENHGKVDLLLIEVRSGSYLGEDDVIRIEEYSVSNR